MPIAQVGRGIGSPYPERLLMSMKRITIERYRQPEPDEDGNLTDEQLTDPGLLHAGCIEGVTDDGHRWALYVSHDGYPEFFWTSRDEENPGWDGSYLIPPHAGLTGKYQEQFEGLKRAIGDGEPDEAQLKQLRRLAYTDRAMRFRDEIDDKGNRIVFVTSWRDPRIEGSAHHTGLAYWRYRQLVDKQNTRV